MPYYSYYYSIFSFVLVPIFSSITVSLFRRLCFLFAFRMHAYLNLKFSFFLLFISFCFEFLLPNIFTLWCVLHSYFFTCCTVVVVVVGFVGETNCCIDWANSMSNTFQSIVSFQLGRHIFLSLTHTHTHYHQFIESKQRWNFRGTLCECGNEILELTCMYVFSIIMKNLYIKSILDKVKYME